MDVNNVRNMVVLKNLPSNIVEEAIVVLKENTKAKKVEMADNYKFSSGTDNEKEDKEYVLKEAEMLVKDYISKIEDNKKQIKKVNVKRLRAFAYISTIAAFIEFLLLI